MPDNLFDSERFLKTLTKKPGVYRMIDRDENIIYVGKARNLKNRVTSYFRASGLQTKTIAMVAKISRIEVTATNSETEALLLEQSLIKSEKPQYNILLRDDKSYPYIFLSSQDAFPRLTLHRGSKKKKGHFFGPYPSAYAVRESIQILQKLFKIRQCDDSYFKNRSRPCLQYQINRCSAPCTGLIDEDRYQQDISLARLFLAGKSRQVLNLFKRRMKDASEAMKYELAAQYRDQVLHLRKIQEEQFVHDEKGDVDVFGLSEQMGLMCVQVMYIRKGKMLGQRTYYPKNELEVGPEEAMEAFLSQYYFGGSSVEIPGIVLVSHEVPDKDLLASALTKNAQRKVQVLFRVRSKRAEWVRMALENAELNMKNYQNNKENILSRFEDLKNTLKLGELPERLECFDVSHTSGEATVASCVVYDHGGPLKSDYRKFNIEGVEPGDDYAATEQAIRRRYTRLKKEEAILPDILVIDGGLGQIRKAVGVLTELGLIEIKILGIAKGPDRKAGLEKFIFNGTEVAFRDHSGGSHLLQHIRDEAHRFAIAGHRNRRQRSRSVSELESIDAVGPKRRRQLLTHFGGLPGVKGASEQEIAKVPGISHAIAQDIYLTLHD